MLRSLRRKLTGDLKANRGSFVAVWLVFTAGIMFYNGTYPAGANFIRLVRSFQQRTHLADLWVELDAAPLEAVDEVRAVEGVSAATGRLVLDTVVEQVGSGSLTTLRVISLPESDDDVNNVVVQEGRAPAGTDEIAVMESFARRHGIRVGDVLRLSAGADQSVWQAQVVGLAASSEYLIAARSTLQPFPTLSTFGVAYALREPLAARSGLAGQVNSIALTVEPGADLNAVRAAVADALAPYTVRLVMDRHQQPATATLEVNMVGNTQLGLVFSLIFLFGSGAIMAVLLGRQVESERRLIGTMRAMGCSRGEVLSYYLVFAVLVAVTGTAVGTPLGYLLTRPVIDFFQAGMLGAPVPFFRNPPLLPFMLFGGIVGLLMALAAAALPAWAASTTDPGLALRPPMPAGIGRLARLRLPAVPRTVRQALRNLLRVPGRTLATVLGTVAGMAIIVVSFGTWDGIDYNFADYTATRRYDFVVTLAEPTLHDALAAQVAGIAGVTGVETGLVMPVTVELSDRSYTALGVALDDEQTFVTFDMLDGAPALSSDDGVWLGQNLRRTLGAEVGDVLRVTVEERTEELTVRGVVKQVLGAPMYVPMSLLQAWTPVGVRPANQATVRADPAQRAQVQRNLADLPGVVAVEDWPATIPDIQRTADFNGDFCNVLLAFGMSLTFIVMFTSTHASLRQRREELAILRMQGVSLSEIAHLVTWETIVATVAGLALGVLPSIWLTAYASQLYDTDVGGFLMAIYPRTWFVAAATLVLIALLSQAPPLLGLRRVVLGDVSKAVNV